MGKEARLFSKFTSEVKGFWERRGQPKGLTKILSNLEQVPEQERGHWAQQVFYYQIAYLHDIPKEEAERALNNLRIAGTIKERFNLKWVDPPGSDNGILEYRRRQFLNTETFDKMPPEGIALLAFLTIETDRSMKDFVKGESAKIGIDRDDYIEENLSDERPSFRSPKKPATIVNKSWLQQTEDKDGFDPFDPKTWKKP